MLFIPNAHFFVHNNSPLVHIINQMQPFHTLPPILWDSCQYFPPIYKVWRDYIRPNRVSLRFNLQRESRKLYVPPTSVTWLQLLSRQANTGTSTALIAEIHLSSRKRIHVLFRIVAPVQTHWYYLRLKLDTSWDKFCYNFIWYLW